MPPIQDSHPSIGGFENDISNRMAAAELQLRPNHNYVNQMANTIKALTDTVEFERRRNDMLEHRMDEYQRLGFDLNQNVQTMKMAQDTRPTDQAIATKFAVIEAALVSLPNCVATAGTVVEQNVAAVEKNVAALQNAKPNEGAVISATFQQQSQESTAVRDAFLRGPPGMMQAALIGGSRAIAFT